MAHMDGRTKERNGALNDLYGPVNTGTKTTWIGEQYAHVQTSVLGPLRKESSTNKTAPTVMQLSATLKAGK